MWYVYWLIFTYVLCSLVDMHLYGMFIGWYALIWYVHWLICNPCQIVRAIHQ